MPFGLIQRDTDFGERLKERLLRDESCFMCAEIGEMFLCKCLLCGSHASERDLRMADQTVGHPVSAGNRRK